MKTFGLIVKLLTAIAAVAGAIYVVATYGDKVVAWAKEMMAKCPCKCCGKDEEACCCESAEEKADEACECAPTEEAAPAEEAPAAPEAPAEVPAAEEAPAEEPVPEAPAAEEDAPVADESEFVD